MLWEGGFKQREEGQTKKAYMEILIFQHYQSLPKITLTFRLLLSLYIRAEELWAQLASTKKNPEYL